MLAAVQSLACVGQRVASDETVRREAEPSAGRLGEVPVQKSAAMPALSTVSRSMPPTVPSERVLLRSSATGSGYELELQSPVGLAPRGFPLMVQLGSLQLRGARESPTVGEYGAVFQLSQAEFDAVPDGAEVILLSSVSGAGRSLGRLDKAALRIR